MLLCLISMVAGNSAIGTCFADQQPDRSHLQNSDTMTDTPPDTQADLTLQLDWSAYQDAGMGDAYADIPKHGGNYAKAIAACINSRQCEADGKQVMCPSYRISEDANLSTGGRVRLLKAALASAQGASKETAPLLTPELETAMDLCVICKGCKRECESNVDMPLIKAEYLAQKYALQPRSWRSRLFADLPALVHRFPWVARLISWRNQSRMVRLLVDPILKLNSDVELPQPRPESARMLTGTARTDDETTAPDTTSTPEKPAVVLFLDTFTRQFEPHIATAAIKVLARGGYEVRLLEPENPEEPGYCCGRTWLAQGMIPKARQQAQRLIQALMPLIDQGYIIVGLEASCVLGLRDDAQALGLDEDIARATQNTFLLEEFLAREIKAKRLDLTFATPDVATLIHGHCHQKATGAMKSVRRVMKLIPEHNFDFINSSCCGMAGSFGLEAEHAEHSRAMAEQELLPSLANNQNKNVVANGFSCRQQIRNHSDAKPMHLAELLAEYMD